MPRPAALFSATAVALALGSAAARPADDPAALAAAAGCVACHHAEKPMLGPTYAAIAERYADTPDAATTLAQQLRAGSRGRWGEAPMPPVPAQQLDDAELARVIDWILSR